MSRGVLVPGNARNRTPPGVVRLFSTAVRQSNQSVMDLAFKWVAGVGAIALAASAPQPISAAPSHEGAVAVCGAPRSAEEVLFLHQQRLHLEDGPARVKDDKVAIDYEDWQQFPLLPEVPRRQEISDQRPIRSGDIALIEATPALLRSPNLVDMSGRRVTITPGPSGFTVGGSALPAGTTVEVTGIPIDLEDDDFAVVEFPFAFPYYGEEYTRGFVHSDGNFSFVYPEWSRLERNYSRAAGGPPRITPFFQDLDPSEGGRVLAAVQGTSLTVTWYDVPLWQEFGLGNHQTFQMILESNGRIEFRYGSLDSPHGVVGVFPGVANRAAVYLDWSNTASTQIPGEPIIAEVFSDKTEMDEFAIVQDFFRHHEDSYDSVVLFNDLSLDASTASLAHAWPVRNNVEGIGEALLDYGPYFGSPRRLSAFVNMGAISDYPVSPLAPIPAIPESSLLTILAHELAHRFLAYTRWKDPVSGLDSRALLGRQLAHWSFYLNTDASVLEGNAITDHGPDASPRFETTAATQAFSQLDKYFMGFVDPSEVPATFLVQNATGGLHFGNASRSPESGVWFNGTRREVRIEDIIEAAGERRPDSTVSQRHFRYAFTLLVDDAESPDPASIRKLNQLRANWNTYVRVQLGEAATTATELVRMLHLSTFPAGGLIKGRTGTARVTIAEARYTDLTVSLDVQEAIASMPSSVVIPAGELFAEFSMGGSETGVTTLTARAAEPGYDTAVTRINVREDLSGLKLVTQSRVVFGIAGENAAESLSYRVVDENRVPYSEIELEFDSSIAGGTPIPDAVTDFQGTATIEWPLADETGAQLLRASVKGEPTAFTLTKASVAQQEPSLLASGIVNAASGEAPSPGRGFAPGSLATIHGVGLAAETTEAETLLVFGNPTLPYSLGGTRVQVGGAASPILSAAPNEVTFQVPFEVAEGSADVVVATHYGRSEFTAIPISPVQPGLFPDRVGGATGASFVRPSSGSGEARAGGQLYAYATGLGAVTPSATTGRPGQSLPPNRVVGTTTAWVDGQRVDVASAALATFEAGIYEVVLELPGTLVPGTHKLKIAVNGVESNEVEFESHHTPLDVWTVESGTVGYGGPQSAGCKALSNAIVGGVLHTIHTSSWQHRESASSPWTDVAGTSRVGQICPYTPTDPGDYRGVAEISIDGSRGVYSSSNTFTIPDPTASTSDGSSTPAVDPGSLDIWSVSSGAIQFESLSTTTCISISNTSINGVSYTIHGSRWQRRAGPHDAWTDISGTEQDGSICSYSPTETGEYRPLAEITIDDTKALYTSSNTLQP